MVRCYAPEAKSVLLLEGRQGAQNLLGRVRRRGDRLRAYVAAMHESVHGTTPTYRDVCHLAAFGGEADISQPLPNNRNLGVHALRSSVEVTKRQLPADVW